jgi:hypothetical protein
MVDEHGVVHGRGVSTSLAAFTATREEVHTTITLSAVLSILCIQTHQWQWVSGTTPTISSRCVYVTALSKAHNGGLSLSPPQSRPTVSTNR